MLAPMTNQQSHPDGTLSDDEFHWLTLRAQGGFGLVMTCASHVQKIGQGFPGQLGIFSDIHIAGHRRLAAAIQSHGSVVVVQLHHAGLRSPKDLIGAAPVAPSVLKKYGSRALTSEEVETLRDDFIAAAIRAKEAGYDGVEVHGAHGYILTQFLSQTMNLRTDKYGGSYDNRKRLLFEIIEGIRSACGPGFLMGVRLSPERFGMELSEIKKCTQEIVDSGWVDFLDISLWDVYKKPEEDDSRTLLDHFTDIAYGDTFWTVAGHIRHGGDVAHVLNSDVDFVSIGRSAIIHHDFPQRVLADPAFRSLEPPYSSEYLSKEGLGPAFIDYMKRWPGFVKEE